MDDVASCPLCGDPLILRRSWHIAADYQLVTDDVVWDCTGCGAAIHAQRLVA